MPLFEDFSALELPPDALSDAELANEEFLQEAQAQENPKKQHGQVSGDERKVPKPEAQKLELNQSGKSIKRTTEYSNGKLTETLSEDGSKEVTATARDGRRSYTVKFANDGTAARIDIAGGRTLVSTDGKNWQPPDDSVYVKELSIKTNWKGEIRIDEKTGDLVQRSHAGDKTYIQQPDGTHISEAIMQDKSTVVEVQRRAEGRMVQRKDPNGDESYTVQFATDGQTPVRLHTRGNATWESRDGRNWYREGSQPAKTEWTKDPEWKGTVRIEDGSLIQASASGRHQYIQRSDGASLKITKHDKSTVSDKRLPDGTREIEAKGPKGENGYTIRFAKDGRTPVFVSEKKQAYVSEDGRSWFKEEKAPPLRSTWPEEPDAKCVISYDELSGSLVEVSDRTGIKSTRGADGQLSLTYTMSDFRTKSLFMFDQLDWTRNDYLSQDELNKAPRLSTVSSTMEYAQMIAVFRKYVDEIKVLNDDQTFFETEIHRKDIERLNDVIKTYISGGKLSDQERQLVLAIAITLKEVADSYKY